MPVEGLFAQEKRRVFAMNMDVRCWIDGKEVLRLALGKTFPKQAVKVAMEILEWQYQCRMAWVGEEVENGVIRIMAVPLGRKLA